MINEVNTSFRTLHRIQKQYNTISLMNCVIHEWVEFSDRGIKSIYPTGPNIVKKLRIDFGVESAEMLEIMRCGILFSFVVFGMYLCSFVNACFLYLLTRWRIQTRIHSSLDRTTIGWTHEGSWYPFKSKAFFASSANE